MSRYLYEPGGMVGLSVPPTQSTTKSDYLAIAMKYKLICLSDDINFLLLLLGGTAVDIDFKLLHSSAAESFDLTIVSVCKSTFPFV